MKLSLLTLLLIPFLSIGQVAEPVSNELSEEDKKSIDENTLMMCNCVTEKMNALHPKTLEVIMLVAEKGEEAAMKDVEALIEAMEPEELQAFMESFTTLESAEFSEEIDVCDGISKLNQDLQDQINNEEGAASDYFMEVLNREDACKFVRSAHQIGSSSE